jgi:hypothetical protein
MELAKEHVPSATPTPKWTLSLPFVAPVPSSTTPREISDQHAPLQTKGHESSYFKRKAMADNYFSYLILVFKRFAKWEGSCREPRGAQPTFESEKLFTRQRPAH